jgi:hypothetical protein
MFFVVSTGRSGTQTMADLLNQSPDAGCFHEPEPRLIAESTRYLYGDLPHADAVALLRRTRPTIPIDREYGEAHHQLSYLIPALHEAFPEAKFVWLIRDGRKTVASMVARRWYTGRHFSPYPNPMIWENWRIRADRLGEMSTSAWLSLSPFEKCCWQWTYKNRLIERQLTGCGGAWMFVRLEELDAQAGELFDFLGLRRPETIAVPQLNKAKSQDGHVPQDWHNWDAEQVSAFMRYDAPGMDVWYPHWRAEIAGVWPTPTALDRVQIELKRYGRRFWNDESPAYRGSAATVTGARRTLPGPVRRVVKSMFTRKSG